jgi:hypothetical protein
MRKVDRICKEWLAQKKTHQPDGKEPLATFGYAFVRKLTERRRMAALKKAVTQGGWTKTQIVSRLKYLSRIHERNPNGKIFGDDAKSFSKLILTRKKR